VQWWAGSPLQGIKGWRRPEKQSTELFAKQKVNPCNPMKKTVVGVYAITITR
jgi:hypothetical protein